MQELNYYQNNMTDKNIFHIEKITTFLINEEVNQFNFSVELCEKKLSRTCLPTALIRLFNENKDLILRKIIEYHSDKLIQNEFKF